MQINDSPFGTTDWNTIEPTHHSGETGSAIWRTRHFGPIRVRMVEFIVDLLMPGLRAAVPSCLATSERRGTWHHRGRGARRRDCRLEP